MADKNNNYNDLEKVSGGAFFDRYSIEDYNRAGVEVGDPGSWFNDSYRLIASGETLNIDQAEGAIAYYERYGRPAINVTQIEVFLLELEKEGPWWLQK